MLEFTDLFDVNEEIEKCAKIIADEFAEIPLKILPLAGKGFVNKVFRVGTANSEFILRTNNADSLDEYEKEKWASRKASEKKIPTPKILRTGVFDNQAYSIQEFVEGTEGRNLAGDKRPIWKKFGEYARKIHGFGVGGFGLSFRDMTGGNSQMLWVKYLEYNIESLNERDALLKLGAITRTESEVVRKKFETLRPRRFRFGLNHGDLSLKNTIVDDSGTIHLIDWGSAEASIVPHHELIQILKMNMLENSPEDLELQAFLRGYGISEKDFDEMLPDLKALSLLRAFDKLRWAIDRKVPGLQGYVSQAKATVEKFL